MDARDRLGSGMAVRVTDLRGRTALRWGTRRRNEPVTTGVPLPRGLVFDPQRLRLIGPSGTPEPLQARPLERWADGSIRWALLDFAADADDGVLQSRAIEAVDAPVTPSPAGLRVTSVPESAVVDTGRLRVDCSRGGTFPFSTVASPDGAGPIARPMLTIDAGDGAAPVRISTVEVAERGPLRAEITLTGVIDGPGAARDLAVFGRLELFRDTSVARVSITIRNTRRARHPGGQWPLGDAGSRDIRSATLTLPIDGIDSVRAADDAAELRDIGLTYECFQASSGGEHWQSPVHRDRTGAVTLPFRGFRRRTAGGETTGLRASPIVIARAGGRETVVALPRCWQTFPRAIAVTPAGLEIALVPREAPIELQGGEQHSTVVVFAFDGDTTSDPPLAWCHDPAIIGPDPDWMCSSGAVPFLTPTNGDPDAEYAALVGTALDPEAGFARKREAADEYGWRHFGDLVADHESAFQPADRPFVSHYNNQYDAIAGFALQFLRSGDVRWWRFMDELARHVRDVDIYHATDDKAAYNGGLFWHTLHYVDAGTSTHRTYPVGAPAGGGPSAEHNYATGLMVHYFLTGDPASRDAAVGLGQWVIDMDDGARTPFRWLARRPTGVASATGSLTYQGPGRGPGNSILSCLAAFRLTGASRFLAKADELIRRCIHPNDDVPARDLLDAERRWYYTVFLQALAAYLQFKFERAEVDGAFAYAQASLLRYARWMAEHERPYLETPDRLEFPTETWVAQDMRKAEVLYAAFLHAGQAERGRFLDRARFFRHYSTSTLLAMPTHRFTRPLVLMLTNGLLGGWCERHLESIGPAPSAPDVPAGAPPAAFVPQKVVAMRRARWLAMAAAAIVIGAMAMFG